MLIKKSRENGSLGKQSFLPFFFLEMEYAPFIKIILEMGLLEKYKLWQ